MPCYLLLIAYEGGDFAGWWRQPGRRTVAGVLDQAFARLGEKGCEAIGAARTDAGVHARGQLAQVTCQREWDPATLAHQLNGQLPEDVVCRGVAPWLAENPLLSAVVGKTYRYRLDIGATRNPFLARTSWRPPQNPLPTLARLQEFSQACVGLHDWRGLSRRGDFREDYSCHISAIDWHDNGPERCCDLSGNRFTYRLVRSLVAVIWALARGDLQAADLAATLAGEESNCSAHQAPARGLCLEQVVLDREIQWHS